MDSHLATPFMRMPSHEPVVRARSRIEDDGYGGSRAALRETVAEIPFLCPCPGPTCRYRPHHMSRMRASHREVRLIDATMRGSASGVGAA